MEILRKENYIKVLKIQLEMIEKSLQNSITHTPKLTLTNYSSDDFHQLNGSPFFQSGVFTRKKKW